MKTKRIWAMFAALVALIVSPALAQPQLAALNAAKREIHGLLGEIEQNLVEAEAIDMTAQSLIDRGVSLKARLEDYNQRMRQLNAYCQGSFPEPELSRRKAYCAGEKSQLDVLLAQLMPERQAYFDQGAVVQRRDIDRQKRNQALMGRFQTAMVRLVTACIALPLADQKALCHLPPAPGPRTRTMVASMEAALTDQLAKMRSDRGY